MPIRYNQWPQPERGRSAVLDIISTAAKEGLIGFDCEFSPETKQAHIFGVASLKRCAADYWSNEYGEVMLEAARAYNAQISAYAGLGADKPVLEHMLGIKPTPLALWSDPMMRWYIMNPDLASVSKSAFSEDETPGVSLGLMNIWSCASMLHDLPQWKECVGPGCIESNRPCGFPQNHNEMDYCAVDAWAGLVCDYSLRERMK